MSNYHYYQNTGGDEKWKPIQSERLNTIVGAMFCTVLSVDTPVSDEASKEQLAALKYSGPLYFDLDDAASPASTAKHAKKLVESLEELDVDPLCLEIFASGGKGFHILVPQECFMAKVPKAGTPMLPAIYKEMAFKLAVPSLDFRVYTARKGRMLRCANVERPNGLYKVRISHKELAAIADCTDPAEAEEAYRVRCSNPRSILDVDQVEPDIASGLMALFDECKAKVSTLTAKTKKRRAVKLPKELPSFAALLRGEGVKGDTGFHQIAMQVAITAHAKGMSKAELLEAAQGLCENHESDGDRYNTPSKRKAELARMWDYTDDNPCYEYSPAAVTNLLTHKAPDLHGIAVSEEEVAESIASGGEGDDPEAVEEFSHAGLFMTRNGAFTLTESGPKMLTAVSFENVTELVSAEDNKVAVLEADVYIAGRKVSNKSTIELDAFNSVSSVNRMLMRHGQAFSGTDVQARGLYLRMVEKARKTNRRMYVSNREGLDIVKIPGHDNEAVRSGFLVWSDNRGVVVPPAIEETGVQMKFVGFPDPHGQYQTDIEDAPKLVEWLKDGDNKESMREFLHDLLGCQSPSHIGKLLGWCVASYWRMLFHEEYDKFPLLHINGAAGQGKCLGVDTPVLMADGTVKMVQDVKAGDKLLGPDGTVRNVLSTTSGREQLYKVIPIKGDPYVVNESHILSLRNSRGVVTNIEVREYLEKSLHWRIVNRGWRVPGILLGNLEPELTQITVNPIGEGDYYGFELDGDKLFLLGDFTVTHNTETTKLFANLHYYEAEPKMLTPTSTLFAITHSMTGSASLPIVLDEFKPAEMNPQVYDKFKLLLRDAYNCRFVERGGGTRENNDYRSVHRSQLSAPVVFISEAAESESALMERVVLITQIKPAAIQASKNLHRFLRAKERRGYLGILGKYIAASIIKRVTKESFAEEFNEIYNATRKELMLSEDDTNLTAEELQRKSGAKERTVFNYAAVRFGLLKIRNLIAGIYGEEFNELFQQMYDEACSSVEDIQSQTVPEWLKVLNTFTDMAHTDPEGPCYLVRGKDYDTTVYNGVECVEFNLRACYHKYRQYMALSRSKALFPGESAFSFAMRNIPALVEAGAQTELEVPGGSYVFNLQELRSSGYIAP